MKDYSKELFIDLDFNRQVKLSLDLIYDVEKNWSVSYSGEPREKALKKVLKLKEMLNWLMLHPNSKEIRISHVIKNLEESNLRQILNIATALERHLSVSLKDDAILVKKEDALASSLNEISNKQPLYVVLDNLRSAFNVGSIFRTCECLGVERIYLVGYTPTPNDKPVKKTAMGTDEVVSWIFKERLSDVIDELKEKDVNFVALETATTAVNLYEAKVKKNSALIFGNERFGLEPEVLEKMHQIVEIPMKGLKNSLNVSNALAISASEIIRSWEN